MYTSRKRKYGKKTSSWKRRVSYAPSREEVKRIARRTFDRNTETKFGYASAGATTVTTGAPTMGLLWGGMAQGTTNLTRIGQQIRTVSFEIRMACDCNAALASRIRVLIIRDKQSNGASRTCSRKSNFGLTACWGRRSPGFRRGMVHG